MIETVAEIGGIEEIGEIEEMEEIEMEDFQENQDLNQKIFVLTAEILDIGNFIFIFIFFKEIDFLLFFNKFFNF